MIKLFGTDGIRGIYGKEITPELIYKSGLCFPEFFNTNSSKKVVIGMDTRLSKDAIFLSISSSLVNRGYDVINIGICPTPALPLIIKHTKSAGGIMISASHNPPEYNGIKFFDCNGLKLDENTEKEFENTILDKEVNFEIDSFNLGKIIDGSDYVRVYVDNVKNSLKNNFQNKKILIDCANGSNSDIAKLTLKELGASVRAINTEYNGVNINKDCGSTHLDGIISEMKKGDYDIGFAFDGDADRVMIIDEKGNLVDGDMILATCARHLKKSGKLTNNTVVATVMSNFGLSESLKEENIELSNVKVGDKYVLHEMQNNNYKLGGEQSGHIIFLDYNSTGDGLLSACQFFDAILDIDKTASYAHNIMKIKPSILVNVAVSDEVKRNYLNNERICGIISNIKEKIDGCGRILIRPSGTEPVIRILVEGDKEQEIVEYSKMLKDVFENN